MKRITNKSQLVCASMLIVGLNFLPTGAKAAPVPNYALIFNIAPQVEISDLTLTWDGFRPNVLPKHLSKRSNWGGVASFGNYLPPTDLKIECNDKNGPH